MTKNMSHFGTMLWVTVVSFVILLGGQVRGQQSDYYHNPCVDLTKELQKALQYSEEIFPGSLWSSMKILTGVDYNDNQLMVRLICAFVDNTDVFASSLWYNDVTANLVNSLYAYFVSSVESVYTENMERLEYLRNSEYFGPDSARAIELHNQTRLIRDLKLKGLLDLLDHNEVKRLTNVISPFVGFAPRYSKIPEAEASLPCSEFVSLLNSSLDLPSYVDLHLMGDKNYKVWLQDIICHFLEFSTLGELRIHIVHFPIAQVIVQKAKNVILHLNSYLDHLGSEGADKVLRDLLLAAREAGLFTRRITAQFY